MLWENRNIRCKTIFKSLTWTCFFVICANTPALPQQNASYIFHRIMQSDGLLHTNVRAITQDARGYIWILTPNGLQRYDGARFVNYPYDVTSPGGIIDTRTATLVSDKKNNCLWIMDKQVEKFDLQTNQFSLFTIDKIRNNPALRFEIYTDSLNHRWYAGDFGVFSDVPFKNMQPYYLSASFLTTNNTSILFTDVQNQQTWMADYWNGLLLFDKKTKKVYTHNYNPIHHPLLQQMDKATLTGIMEDSEHNIWINTNTPQFYRYNIPSKKLFTYSLAGIATSKKITDHATLYVESFFEDSHHAIWMGTANLGLLKYNREKDAFIFVVDEEKNLQGLNYNYGIGSIFQDADENIWLGTDKGISIFNPYRQQFKVMRHQENDPSSLPKDEIESFIQTRNGHILIGTWGGGITVYDSNWNFIKTIRFNGPFEYNLVWSFVQNDDGNIWAGCQHGYIHIYDPLTQRIKTIHPPELNNYTIHCLTKDKQGNIWFGLHDGKIAEWNKQEQKFYAYNDSAGKVEQRLNGALNIFFDSRQRCWVSTELGLKEFDTKKRMYSAVYLPDAKNPNSISASTIQGIEQYNDSTLIIGTLHGGINLFNINSKKFTRIGTSDELLSNTVCAIKKDAKHNFWLTTDYGIYKLDPSGKKFIRYNIEPGVINSSFKTVNFYTLKNEGWLAATATEVVCFNPSSMDEQNAKAGKVEITGFKIFDSTIFIDSLLTAHQSVHLSYKQNFLTIEFSLLHFFNRQTTYYYKLSGVNSDWVSTNTKQFASYTNLQPGEYTFSVRAENGNEIIGTTSFKIIITPPFWRAWWFTLITIVAAVSIIFLLVRRRIQSIKRQAELKQKLAETEMLALRSQMNPHFIFNCLNAIDNLIQTNQPDKATTYLARFAKLIRYLLESSKNNLVPFYKDFDTLQLYLQLEQFRSGNKFTYELHADKELLQGDYKVPPLVIQPFVENAIQHGLLNKQEGEKTLTVNASLKNNYILYTILDNGVGRVKAMEIKNLNKPEHKSYGIEISSERIHLHNQNGSNGVIINDIHEKNITGTEVQVKIKI